MDLTVDNQFDAYFGTAMATTFFAGTSANWKIPVKLTALNRAPTDFVYVATASDQSVAQGFLGTFTNTTTGKTFDTGDSAWEVFPAGAHLQALFNMNGPWPAGVMPTQAQVDAAIAYATGNGLWQATDGFPNWDNRVLGNITIWGHLAAVPATAKWIWHNTGSANPLRPGANHDEFLIFRIAGAAGAGPCPGSLLVNGHFNGFVPEDGSANGWTASFNTGGWEATIGNPAPSYWLNNSQLPTDPTLTQVVTGLTVGKCYTLSGDFASWAHNDDPGNTDSFAVYINGVLVFKGKPGPLLQWQHFTVDFTATAATATIDLMAEWNGTDNDFLVDNICLVPCPIKCATPPSNMTLWLPFDECSGGTAKNLAGPKNGTLNFPVSWHTQGKVGCAVCFDTGYVDVPSHAAVQPQFGDFTIDAWIRPGSLPIQGGIIQVIVDKMAFSSTLVPHGYSFYLLNNELWFTVADGVGAASNFAGPAIPPTWVGTWIHVAAAVTRTPSKTDVDFYINSNKTTVTGPPESGFIANLAPFRVGAASTSFSSTLDGFMGCIDEVEFFKRRLSEQEIKKIFDGDEEGKCKQFCQPPTASVFCKDAASITVTVPICNGTTMQRTYSLSFPPVTGCGTVASPSGITANPSTVIVNPGACTSVTLTIPRPAFTQPGDTSCYTVCATDVTTGNMFCCEGSVVLSSSVCGQFPINCCLNPIPTLDMADIGPVGIDGDPDLPTFVEYFVIVNDQNNNPDTRVVGLNGEEPGVPVMGEMTLPPGGHGSFDLAASFWIDDPFGAYTVVVMADIDGDGIPTPLASTVVRNRLADDCRSDVDGSGFVDFDDFTYYVG
ncbi:MAG: LamG domain-containing protein, partial [Phycisphaerales bacterium]|nr:LamG domain-containing protein [Phycisphaerales bacterium]